MAGMACAEHDRLRDALVQAMLAEDRTRDSGWVAAGVSVPKRIEAQQGAHSKVSLAETLIIGILTAANCAAPKVNNTTTLLSASFRPHSAVEINELSR
jgi:hypothetical protein